MNSPVTQAQRQTPDSDPENFEKCPCCGGEGEWEEACPFPDDPYYAKTVRCDECTGSGWIRKDPEPPDPMRGVEFPFAENH